MTKHNFKKYLADLYILTQDKRLNDENVRVDILKLIDKGSKITGLSISDLLLRLDFKSKDLTFEAFESFLAELRSIFWLEKFGFKQITPIPAKKTSYPDFIVNDKNNLTYAIEVFCLTRVHGQQRDPELGVFVNSDPEFQGSKFGRDFITKAPEKKIQLDAIKADKKILLCCINSEPVIYLNSTESMYNHAKYLHKRLKWGNNYYIGFLTGLSDTIYPPLI